MQALDPAACPQDVFRCGQMPGLGRDAAEFNLNAVFKRAGASVGELALWVERHREVGAGDEVVTGDVIHDLLGENDEEVL